MDNKPKEKEAQTENQPAKKIKISRKLVEILDGSFLTKDTILKHMPFLYFLFFLSLLYISNTYYAEKTFKEIKQLKNQVKEMHSEHISLASKVMSESKQSEVAKKVVVYGLKESVVPPQKIIITKEELYPNE